MTGCLILTVSPLSLQNLADDAGSQVAAILSSQGIPISARQVVDEDEPALEAALRWAVEAHRLTVVLSPAGGSAGEVVRRVVARVSGTRLVLSQRLLGALEIVYGRRGQAVPRRLDRLALLPQGATLWSVEEGRASWFLETGQAVVAVLPETPAIVSEIATRHLVPLARERFGGKEVVLLRTLRAVGLSPGEVEERLGEWLGRQGAVAVSCVPAEGEVWVRLRARAASLPMAEAALRKVEGEVAGALGENCYGRNQESLEAVVGRLLAGRRLTLSVAESCTGGLLSSRITDIPGSSAYFERGVVAYSNRAKEELLAVPRSLLTAHGAVSAPVAEAMARGIRQSTGTSVGLAITGIAGPEGGSRAKPVGTVYVALATPEGTHSQRFRFSGGREAVKWQSTQMALDLLRRHLIEREARR